MATLDGYKMMKMMKMMVRRQEMIRKGSKTITTRGKKTKSLIPNMIMLKKTMMIIRWYQKRRTHGHR